MCSLCFCIGTHILLLGLSEIQAASIYNFGQHFSHFNPVLFLCLCPRALCQCNRTRAGLQNDRLAPLVQSELLIRFSVRLTFVNTRRATPAFPKRWFVTSKHFIFLPPFLWFRFILCNFISKTKKHKEKQSCMVTICVFSVIVEVCRYASYCFKPCNECRNSLCTHMNTQKSTQKVVESDLFCYQSTQQQV